ncbi:polysaccharide deacetylase family protein [Kitasatospora cathayae]|uniref:Polysaccharide deacetylase family protein n=1 Tax=Kitasatospora cathayae TaxID=3004092 RepID=A0ABY7QDK8_9ACTN|nr:polysaccharide deacetylase family protein [Kitasatospora sp. HUAS 3-15]WBP90216.1 polysaccharide deacetylase family protein [Kitasatospora sp. HUAS 3-15]
MLSDRQIKSPVASRVTSRRLLLVAAGMSLLGAAAGCKSPWSGDGSSSTNPDAAAGAPEVLLPADGAASPSASASSPVPSPAPPSASATPWADASGVQPVRKALSDAESKPVYELDPAQRVVALTIDDGPDPKYTPAVLDLLQQHGIRATFFLIGENAVEHPALVKEIADRGHHIANHTWTHPDLRHMSESAVRDELERTSDLLQRTAGRLPTWFRAPGGDWSPVSLKVAADLGLRNMAWSVDPRDWARPGTSAITERILKDVRPGSIVLNHDGGGDRSQTVAALKLYLPALIDSGYYFTAPPN